MTRKSVTTKIYPAGMLNILSHHEVNRLQDASKGNLSELFRRCALAVLNSGGLSDDAEALLADYEDFQIKTEFVNRGLRMQLSNAPASAFVDGKIIEGVREQLSSVVRDLIYYHSEIESLTQHNSKTTAGLTNIVFEILRNARAMIPQVDPALVVCWGGHSIAEHEYDYTKQCGYQLGLRKLNIITGCGPGAMKGPMKGANLAHAKQRQQLCRYIGISEPGIIAAESPNAIVNELVIMPDIEKRLEAFVRLGHGVIVFPGGVGTAEEILYLLGILLNPKNSNIPFPLIFTGPKSAAEYFQQIDEFIKLTLGKKAASLYQIIIDDPEKVAKTMRRGIQRVRKFRIENNDAFYFNWLLEIDHDFQQPFVPTHKNMSDLNISKSLKPHELAANLRRVFSGIVAGNIKPEGREAVRRKGKFKIRGEEKILRAVDRLLQSFIAQDRMKIPGKTAYQQCYTILS